MCVHARTDTKSSLIDPSPFMCHYSFPILLLPSSLPSSSPLFPPFLPLPSSQVLSESPPPPPTAPQWTTPPTLVQCLLQSALPSHSVQTSYTFLRVQTGMLKCTELCGSRLQQAERMFGSVLGTDVICLQLKSGAGVFKWTVSKRTQSSTIQ